MMVLALCCVGGAALGNGGPFVMKYPGGDPSAKGVLARLEPDLKPRRETRLRVVKEDLGLRFGIGPLDTQPVVNVEASYTISNPTSEEIVIDLGFPILRGIYISPLSMTPSPSVQVTADGQPVKCTVISNSAIYGIIRQLARTTIDASIASDPALKRLAAAVRDAGQGDRAPARAALADHLVRKKKWNERDAALLVEYAALGSRIDRGTMVMPAGGWLSIWHSDEEVSKLTNSALGPLASIGDQKATQFLAQLASCFDARVATTYERIFSLWGGDVKEMSIDLTTGKLRPREFSVDAEAGHPGIDEAVYARVDYFEDGTSLTEEDKASCQAILKNLPVIFTFAPMNLLHYQVTFPPDTTRNVTVSYKQYARSDTRPPASYQFSYVLHPASFWEYFGPINLEVAVPEGAKLLASVPCVDAGPFELGTTDFHALGSKYRAYRARLRQKTGELVVAVDAGSWSVPDGSMLSSAAEVGVE